MKRAMLVFSRKGSLDSYQEIEEFLHQLRNHYDDLGNVRLVWEMHCLWAKRNAERAAEMLLLETSEVGFQYAGAEDLLNEYAYLISDAGVDTVMVFDDPSGSTFKELVRLWNRFSLVFGRESITCEWPPTEGHLGIVIDSSRHTELHIYAEESAIHVLHEARMIALSG